MLRVTMVLDTCFGSVQSKIHPFFKQSLKKFLAPMLPTVTIEQQLLATLAAPEGKRRSKLGTKSPEKSPLTSSWLYTMQLTTC